MSQQNISFFSDKPVKKHKKAPHFRENIIAFVAQKKAEAGLTNKEIAKRFPGKNITKILRELDNFDRTGYLKPVYMDRLSEILDFSQEDIDALQKAFYEKHNRDKDCFLENFDLLYANKDRIIQTLEFANITAFGIRIHSAWVSRHRPLTLGELFEHYANDDLIAQKRCCGKIYIFAASGSALSGAHQYQGICSVCKTIIRGRNDTYGSILHPFMHYTPSFEYEETDWTIPKLVEHLKEDAY